MDTKLMKTKKEALQYGLSFPDTYQDAPFRDQSWQLVRYRPNKKVFLWVYEKDGFVQLNVKADQEWRDFWRKTFASVIPGYHQNKNHWNTLILDGTIPDRDIRRMIAESYDLISDSPTKRIYEAVKKVPEGKVATYGQIAEMAGNPRMSRAVGNALHKVRIRRESVLSCRQFERRTFRGICVRRKRQAAGALREQTA